MPNRPPSTGNLRLAGTVRTSMYTHRHLGVRHDTARSTGAPHLMTRDPVGRRGVGTFDSLRRLDTATVLTTILVLGLALRVFIAAFYMPLSGLSNDIEPVLPEERC